ncbi:7-cyano-7-deazaguanine synthase [Enterobacter cancerogenus]|uniref:7-cyano-7-deazaguanine synthase n=1 Tax=Enterobacter cancerogenus TaxID=69218 RepID=A0A484Z6R1_9ENTR|nr:7-cyano-7-deazaguanine synthase [Enterobacter cancerogenus]
MSLFSILAKTKESDKWGAGNAEDLLAIIGRQGWTARHVVITGGEPCIHDLMPLTELLEKNGYSCQIETSGTHEVRCSHTTWVTVSPKVNMRGGYDVLSQALERADEIKHPVGRVRDIEALDELLATLTDEKTAHHCATAHQPERGCHAACASKPALRVTGVCLCKRIST